MLRLYLECTYIPPLLITDIMKLSVELHLTWKTLEIRGMTVELLKGTACTGAQIFALHHSNHSGYICDRDLIMWDANNGK